MNNSKERNKFFLITGIITLILSVYVLYVTVFEQIISQNQGYFYAVVFGFILLLVFLLCNLFTKLIATSASVQQNVYWKITSIVILVVMGAMFMYSRLSLHSSLDAQETSFFKAAISMVDDLYSQNTDLVEMGLNNPTQYIYSVILSLIMRIFGTESRVLVCVNTVLYIICGYLIYDITLKLSDRLCALFSTFLIFVIPSSTFAVYAYNTDPIFSLILLVTMDLYTGMYLTQKDLTEDNAKKDYKLIIQIALCCIFSGIMLFAEPVMIIPLILLIVAFFCTKRKTAFYCLIALCAGLVIFIILSFTKSLKTNVSLGEVFVKDAGAFNIFYDTKTASTDTFSDVYESFSGALASQDENISNSYYFLTDSEGQVVYTDMKASWIIVANQLVYMFLLVMLISCLIIAIKDNYDNVMTLNILAISSILVIFFEQNRETHKHSFMSILVVACGVSLHYLYLNHHPEQKVILNALDALEQTGRTNDESSVYDESEVMDEAEFERRARALIFIDNDEDLYRKIKNEERKKAMSEGGRVNPLENTFDDYDEDFFLDNEDNTSRIKQVEVTEDNNIVPVENVAPINNVETTVQAPTNTNKEDIKPAKKQSDVPVWKQRPEKMGADDMFFDEADEEDLVKEGKHIENPLPVPKKKQHKPIDYEVKEDKSGWDYDYDVDDDDDWDV